MAEQSFLSLVDYSLHLCHRHIVLFCKAVESQTFYESVLQYLSVSIGIPADDPFINSLGYLRPGIVSHLFFAIATVALPLPLFFTETDLRLIVPFAFDLLRLVAVLRFTFMLLLIYDLSVHACLKIVGVSFIAVVD